MGRQIRAYLNSWKRTFQIHQLFCLSCSPANYLQQFPLVWYVLEYQEEWIWWTRRKVLRLEPGSCGTEHTIAAAIKLRVRRARRRERKQTASCAIILPRKSKISSEREHVAKGGAFALRFETSNLGLVTPCQMRLPWQACLVHAGESTFHAT